MEKKKRIMGALIAVALILMIFIAGYTFARYYQVINGGTANTNIARWSFGSKNENAEIELSKEKIAPGSNGQFEIEVDATDSEVAVDYEIKVSNEKNIPTNMKFHAVTKDEKGQTISTTNDYSSFTELAQQNLIGNIPVENNNQKRNIIVYWNWDFNENDETFVDSNDATLSYDSEGVSSLKCGFDVEIVGKQSKS